MHIIESLQWRYATKTFDSQAIIEPDKINLLYQAFNLTATSYGLQPVKLVVIKNKKTQATLVKHSMNQQQVAEASHLFVLAIDTALDASFVLNYFDRVKEIRDTPDRILEPFREFLVADFQQKSQSEKELWATKQAYVILGNLLTVCASLKIDACPMEGFSPEAYDEVLELHQKKLKSVLVLPIGYRAKGDIFANLKKVRKPLKEMVLEF